jgi:hypothetical protein
MLAFMFIPPPANACYDDVSNAHKTAIHMGFGVAQYLQRQGVNRFELEKLIQDLLHHRWAAIPVVSTVRKSPRALKGIWIEETHRGNTT